jgi:hypothetical protein
METTPLPTLTHSSNHSETPSTIEWYPTFFTDEIDDALLLLTAATNA